MTGKQQKKEAPLQQRVILLQRKLAKVAGDASLSPEDRSTLEKKLLELIEQLIPECNTPNGIKTTAALLQTAAEADLSVPTVILTADGKDSSTPEPSENGGTPAGDQAEPTRWQLAIPSFRYFSDHNYTAWQLICHTSVKYAEKEAERLKSVGVFPNSQNARATTVPLKAIFRRIQDQNIEGLVFIHPDNTKKVLIYKELLMDPVHGDPQPSLKGTSFIKGLGSLVNNTKAQAKSKGR